MEIAAHSQRHSYLMLGMYVRRKTSETGWTHASRRTKTLWSEPAIPSANALDIAHRLVSPPDDWPAAETTIYRTLFLELSAQVFAEIVETLNQRDAVMTASNVSARGERASARRHYYLLDVTYALRSAAAAECAHMATTMTTCWTEPAIVDADAPVTALRVVSPPDDWPLEKTILMYAFFLELSPAAYAEISETLATDHGQTGAHVVIARPLEMGAGSERTEAKKHAGVTQCAH